MKKAINIWSLPEREAEKCFPLAKECGYDGVEVSLGREGPVRLDSTEKELTEFRRKAESYGMPLFSLVCDVGWEYSISSDDKDVRKKGEEIIIKQLETSAILGCDTTLVICGMVKTVFPGGDIVRYDLAYERALESTMRVAEYAEKYNVNYAIENVGNKFLLSPLETRDFIDKVNSPKVKHYFDVGNVIRTGYPDQWIDILGNRIAKVHVKDCVMENGVPKARNLLEGEIDYKAVMNSLRNIGYDDWLTLELQPTMPDLKEFLKINAAAIDKMINEM